MNTSAIPSQIPNNVACPPSSHPKMLEVRNYTPQMGRSGTTVVIETYIHSPKQVSIRIVIGSKAIYTSVENVQGVTDLWRCTGSVPDFRVHKNTSNRTVIVSIQALDGCRVLDSVSFGYFTYWEYAIPPPIKAEPNEGKTFLDVELPPSGRRTLLDPGSQETATQLTHTHYAATPEPPASSRRLPRRSSANDQGPYDKVLLNFEGEPADLGKNLSIEEVKSRRRLIKFYCVRKGNTIHVSSTPIREDDPEKSHSSGVVISCIWRKDVDETCFTSCDLIRLLEYLVQDSFPPEERSRVRRNVEHLRPITASKTRLSELFGTIMGLPSPKPRNIEKDVKIFKWDRLVECVNSALSKYEWVTVSSSSEAPSPQPPARSPVDSSEGPVYTDSNVTIQHPRPYHFSAIAAPDISAVTDRLGSSQLSFLQTNHISPPLLHSQSAMVGPKYGGDSSTGMPVAEDSNLAYSPKGPFLGFDPLGFLNLRAERDAHHDLALQYF
ncbi:hypothetical protein EI94DRAFT_801568 [Lactarius quietus]|nr:hypothetical protein EI94DRAFT_801568 [Lactarius quietus]